MDGIKVKWVCQLPDELQAELILEAVDILKRVGLTAEEISETIENVKNEKLINIIGSEDGLLPYEKWIKYVM